MDTTLWEMPNACTDCADLSARAGATTNGATCFWHFGIGWPRVQVSIDTPMGEGVALRLRLPPMIMDAPFGIDFPDDITESSDSTKKSKTKRWRAAKRASSPIPKTWTTIHDGRSNSSILKNRSWNSVSGRSLSIRETACFFTALLTAAGLKSTTASSARLPESPRWNAGPNLSRV